MNQYLPCSTECYVVYGWEKNGKITDLNECRIVAWEIDEGVLAPIPADQLWAESCFDAIRIGDLYYGEFSISGQPRDFVIEYLNKREVKKKSR